MPGTRAAPDPPQGFPFRALRLLGRGSGGEVWLAEDPRFGTVAVKLVPGSFGAGARERLTREHRLLERLRHPHLVRALALETAPSLALVLEHVAGRPLLAALDGDRHPGPEERAEPTRVRHLVSLLVQLLDALGALHELGLVHRDVKPDNVLVTAAGSVKLVDLGLAGEVEGAAGTLRYMAPEVLAGGDPGARADLYAVGALACEALTGAVPFGDRLDPRAFAQARLNRDPPAPGSLNPALSPAISATVHRLIARRETDRPTDAAAAARELLLAAHGEAGTVSAPAAAETAIEVASVTAPAHAELRERAFELASRALGARRAVTMLLVAPEEGGAGPLAAELAARLSPGRPVVRLSGRGELAPLAALATLVEEAALALALGDPMDALIDYPRARALAGVCAATASLPGFDLLPELPSLAPDRAAERSAEAAAELARTAARDRPLAVVLEDAHLATAATRRALALLAGTDDVPVLVVATSVSRLPELESELGRDAVLELPRLDAAAVAALAREALGAPATSELAAWLGEVGDGLAERTLDALRAAASAAALIRAAGFVGLASGAEPRLALAAWRARWLEALPAPARALAQALAVAGSPLSHGDLIEVTRLGRDEADAAAQALLAARLVRAQGGSLALRAPSFAAATAGSLTEPERHRLHAALAGLAERRGEHRVAAGHWLEAGELVQARPLLLAAARDALRFRDFAALHRFAAAGLQADPDESERIAFRALRARALLPLGQIDEAASELDALELRLDAGTPLEPRIERDVLEALWERTQRLGGHDRLATRLRRFLDRLDESREPALCAHGHQRLALVERTIGHFATADEQGHRAIRLYLALGDRAELAAALLNLATIAALSGRHTESERHLRRAIRFARGLGMHDVESNALRNLGTGLAARGEALLALAAYRQALELARRTGLRSRALACEINAIECRVQLGQYGDARATVARLSRAGALPDSRLRLALDIQAGITAIRAGQPGEALTHLDAAVSVTSVDQRDYLPKTLFYRAEARQDAGDDAGAEADLAWAEAVGREQNLDWTTAEAAWLRARGFLRAGRDGEAARLAREAIPDAERRSDRPVLARSLAILAAATSDAAAAERALAVAAELGDPDVELSVRAARLRVLALTGDPERHASERRQALTLLERMAAAAGPDGPALLDRHEAREVLAAGPSVTAS